MDGKKIGGAILALAGTALAQEAVVRTAYKLWDLIHGAGPLTFTDVRTLLGIAAIAFGCFLIFRSPSRTDRRVSTFLAQVTPLLVPLSNIARGGGMQPTSRLYGEIISAYVSLDKMGIETPATALAGHHETFVHANGFLSAIVPMVRDGHIEVARREAPNVLAVIGVPAGRPIAPSMPVRLWQVLTGAWPSPASQASP